MGGKEEKIDKTLKETTIRECMEEMDLTLTCWDMPYIDEQDEKANHLREKFYAHAIKNIEKLKINNGNKDKFYALCIDLDMVIKIKENFYHYFKVIDEKDTIVDSTEEQKKDVEDIQAIFKDKGNEDDKIYVKKWAEKLSKFFIKLLPDEKLRSKRKIYRKYLESKLKKAIQEYFKNDFYADNVQAELDILEKHIADQHQLKASQTSVAQEDKRVSTPPSFSPSIGTTNKTLVADTKLPRKNIDIPHNKPKPGRAMENNKWRKPLSARKSMTSSSPRLLDQSRFKDSVDQRHTSSDSLKSKNGY